MDTKKTLLKASIINQIQNYIIDNKSITFKLKDFPDKLNVFCYSFPSSFNNAHSKRQLKNAKLNSFYELMNVLYEKVGIQEVDLKTIQENGEFYFLHIEYSVKPTDYEAQFVRWMTQTVLIIQTSDPEIFKMTFKKGVYIDYVASIINSENVDIENPENDIHKQVLLDLEKVFYGICQKINIEIPKEIDTSKFEDVIIKSPDLESFINFLALTTRNGYDVSEYKKDAKRMQKLFEKSYDEYKYSEKFRNILSEYHMRDKNDDDVILYESFFNSDWKFDPEDLIAIVGSITGNEFSFDYPDETYAHELFPYVQTALAKQDLELMSVDTGGDSYFFFIANKNEVSTIIELSQSIGIAIQILT